MSLEPCGWCYNSQFLTETYGNSINDFEIYLGDPTNFPKIDDPKKFVAGMILPHLKEIRLRKDLQGIYDYVPVDKVYKINNKEVLVKGRIPIHLPEKVVAHEFEHWLDLDETSEEEIDRRALEKYKDYYVKKSLSYIV